MKELIAILDVGKTHAKLVFVDASGCELLTAKHRNTSRDTPMGRQLDVASIEQWAIESFRSTPLTSQVRSIVPIAHGATAVLLDANDDVVAAPDYEDVRFSEVEAEYERARDDFAGTLSPSLPCGLNLARQLFYLQRQEPGRFARVAHALLYPQYWAWRFSGVKASEVTSLGCHTDLWLPREARYSKLAQSHGWQRLFPKLRDADDTLGPISAEMAQSTGLDASCTVTCGIHDSNASYLEHLIQRQRDEPFAVISSGTWTVVMARHTDLSKLEAGRDMLANVDAFGSPIATARFMGGREYEAISGGTVMPDESALAAVVASQAYALPSFATAGPFPLSKGQLIKATALDPPQRAALATVYSALMCDLLLESLDARGPVIVDGPLGANPLFSRLLASWRSAVFVHRESQGVCARAALFLSGRPVESAEPLMAAEPLSLALADYRQAWRDQLPSYQ
ncbi:MAG: FGGY-family carbohydrate kinase [Povalibacter sp.]